MNLFSICFFVEADSKVKEVMVLEALALILSFYFYCHCINDAIAIHSPMWHARAGVQMVKGLGIWDSDGRWWCLVKVPTGLWTFCSPLTCITSYGNLIWRWIVLCCFLFFFSMLELTSCLALCEMYWPSFCARDDRGLLVFSVCFVMSILENKAWRDPLILLRLLSLWHYSIYLRIVSF